MQNLPFTTTELEFRDHQSRTAWSMDRSCVMDCSLVCNKYSNGKHLETFMVFDITETSSPGIIFLVLPICNSISIVLVYEGLEMKETERSVFFPLSNYSFIVWFSTFSEKQGGINMGPGGRVPRWESGSSAVWMVDLGQIT